MIKIEALSKTFGGTAALQSLTLEVAAGEVLGYLGPNGAGKTTTIRLLLGLIQPSSGRAEVAGAAMFAGIGALLSQLAANRRQANGLGAGVLGVSFLICVVADSTSGVAWVLGFRRRDLAGE